MAEEPDYEQWAQELSYEHELNYWMDADLQAEEATEEVPFFW